MFAISSVESIEGCFHPRAGCCVQTQHERFCENVFKLRCSEKFMDSWSEFLGNSIHKPACPTFFQAVTDRIVDVLIQNHFVLESTSKTPSVPVNPLDNKVIRCMAGYVIHSLKRKTKSDASSHEGRYPLFISAWRGCSGRLVCIKKWAYYLPCFDIWFGWLDELYW